ncbi:AraC family transcriptional regulator [Halomonas sp. V046]|uniref:AraC family transcriptional regulator n=1 Tax=Halomonas sp. V046 TaxID=3459611 RepID=UPI004044CCFC
MPELNVPMVEPRAYPDRVLCDRHGFHQLLLGLSGGVELEVEGRSSHVTEGVLAVVPALSSHHYLAPCANRILVLDLPQRWCESLELNALFDGSAGGWTRRLPADVAAQAPALLAHPGGLARWLSRVEDSVARGLGRRVGGHRLRLIELLPLVRTDLASPWRVADMAARCHLAEAAFARQFSALVGCSPYAWLTRERLALARRLMQDRHASLTDIALACGFADSAHFSRVFRRQHDLSPRQWRAERRAACLSEEGNGQESTSLRDLARAD